jgi:hypothetical protein
MKGMWDQYRQEYFTLKAIIFVCIHDAPVGFTISWQTIGKSGCPICVDGTTSIYLPSSTKMVSCDIDGSWRENISTAG